MSPPRRVFVALSGCRRRGRRRSGRGSAPARQSSTTILLRLFAACRASAGAPGATTLVGCSRRSPPETSDLAEAAELEVLGDVEVLRVGDEHALVPARGRRCSPPAGRRRSAATVPVPHTVMLAAADRDLGLALVLADRAASRSRGRRRSTRSWLLPLKTKMPSEVAGSRVTGEVLQVEAAQCRRGALVVADHDTAHGPELCPTTGLVSPDALDRADGARGARCRGRRRTGAEGPRVVGRRVRRVVGVVVADAGRR